MQYRILGKTGQKVSALGFGCMRLPTLQPGEPAIDREAAVKLIRKGIDVAICGTCINTRGLKIQELVDGVVRGSMKMLSSWITESDKVISF